MITPFPFMAHTHINATFCIQIFLKESYISSTLITECRNKIKEKRRKTGTKVLYFALQCETKGNIRKILFLYTYVYIFRHKKVLVLFYLTLSFRMNVESEKMIQI